MVSTVKNTTYIPSNTAANSSTRSTLRHTNRCTAVFTKNLIKHGMPQKLMWPKMLLRIRSFSRRPYRVTKQLASMIRMTPLSRTVVRRDASRTPRSSRASVKSSRPEMNQNWYAYALARRPRAPPTGMERLMATGGLLAILSQQGASSSSCTMMKCCYCVLYKCAAETYLEEEAKRAQGEKTVHDSQQFDAHVCEHARFI